MSLLSKLFGGSKSDPQPAEEYKGFSITMVPQKEGSQYRLSALIEKDGQQHRLLRADTLPDLESANAAALAKAKQVIDQMGDDLF
ncbi:MAG: HlyU family transcriptional regulator [Pseudomonadota bacterium]